MRALGSDLASTSEPGTPVGHPGNVFGEVGGQAASRTWFLCCGFLRGRLSEGAAGRRAREGMTLHSLSGCL